MGLNQGSLAMKDRRMPAAIRMRFMVGNSLIGRKDSENPPDAQIHPTESRASAFHYSPNDTISRSMAGRGAFLK